ncbi:MAG: penicillin acylase family protein, partial [Bdellovibrionales bacterium]|nr:penicillin acylase family protein [Bdellovibrionales bacterium]
APFGSIGVDTFEPWTGVDCLIAYTAISSHFTGGEGGELPAEMKFQHDVDALGTQGAVELWQSESQFKDWDSAIIQTNPQLLMSQVNRSGLSSLLPETLKASHNWVVDGAHNTSGAPVMVSMPMLDLEKRWLLEAQIDSPSFHAHGVAMVGTPGFLIGYTPSTAWSATALGSDLADLFRLQAPQEMPEATHYRLDNQDVPFTIREEEIHVLGHSSETIAVRESYFGPVVSIGNDGTKYALKHIILSDLDDGRIHPLEGMFALAQGKTLTEMKEAAWKLFYPSIHLLYATKDPAPTGGIGYRPAAALPIRSNAALLQGVIPQDGSLSSSDWQGFYSEQATPFMHNPASGVIVTANGLPTDDASIYGYQASGTTERGWRARKLLQDLFDEHGMLTPDEIASVRFDCGLELAESVRTLTNYLVKNYPALIPQNDEAFVALSYLNAWDGSLDTSSPYAPMARVVRSIARNKDFYAHTSMSRDYPFPAAFFRSLDVEGESYSLANDYVEDAIQWVFIGILPTAWQLVNSSPSESEFGHGSDPQFWNSYVKKTISIPYVEGITLKETVDPAFDIETEQVICPSKLTLHSQEGNFYTQITPLIDINGSQTAIAPGNSDNPASQFYSSELSGFQVGKVSASPIDRNLIESNCVATSVEGCSYEKPLYDPQ